MISQRLWMVECMDVNYVKRKWNSDGLLANCCDFEMRRTCSGFKTDFTLIISALSHSHVCNNRLYHVSCRSVCDILSLLSLF